MAILATPLAAYTIVLLNVVPFIDGPLIILLVTFVSRKPILVASVDAKGDYT